MDDTQRTGWQKRILLFLTSQCITLFGSTLVQMALVWYATMQTSSGVWVAAFTVCSYLPQFLISFIGGVWADRYHRKKLIIGADLLIAFVTFVMVLAIPHISSEPALLGGLLGIEACVIVLITTCLGAIVINLSRNIIVTSVVGVIYGFASCLFIGSENGFVIPGSFAYRVSMSFLDKATYYDAPVPATIGGCISFVLCFAVMFLVGLLVFSHKKKIEN